MRINTGGVFELVFYSAFVLLSAGMLLRYALIAAGLFKGPVLSIFARYESNDHYYALPWVLVSTAVLAGSVSLLIGLFEPVAARGAVIGVFFGVLAYGSVVLRDQAQAYPQIFCPLPLWVAQLRSQTTREERRRIAFLWLRLPWRTRIRYDVSHHHFWLWCDLVILGTITQTMHDAAVEASGQFVSHDMEKRLYP